MHVKCLILQSTMILSISINSLTPICISSFVIGLLYRTVIWKLFAGKKFVLIFILIQSQMYQTIRNLLTSNCFYYDNLSLVEYDWESLWQEHFPSHSSLGKNVSKRTLFQVRAVPVKKTETRQG